VLNYTTASSIVSKIGAPVLDGGLHLLRPERGGSWKFKYR